MNEQPPSKRLLDRELLISIFCWAIVASPFVVWLILDWRHALMLYGIVTGCTVWAVAVLAVLNR
jgi:hypothetical protein